MRETGGTRKLTEEVEQILLDIQGVERILLTLRVHLIIFVEIVLGWSQKVTEINLSVIGRGGVALLAVLIVPVILVIVLGFDILIGLNNHGCGLHLIKRLKLTSSTRFSISLMRSLRSLARRGT